MDDDLYVLVSFLDGKPSLCYINGRTPFIGKLKEAKNLLSVFQEWQTDQDIDYVICSVTEHFSVTQKD